MQTTIQYIHAELSGIYPTEEIMGITKILLEHVTGWNYTQQVINAHKSLLDRDKEQINSIVKRLKEYEPVQYILGKTEFYGLKIRVSPAVLIPRPETEELVALVLQKNIMEKPKILDLGTGSGCIALALKSRLKNATVTGVDISGDALEIARENAKLNGLDVCFLKGNMLKWRELSRGKYDIIVSNPPYVTEKEKTAMEPNVLNYEPSDALFVPDDDPLVFYRAVAELSKNQLVNGGSLFLEINANFANGVEILLNKAGFKNIEVLNDLSGKGRFVFCKTEKHSLP